MQYKLPVPSKSYKGARKDKKRWSVCYTGASSITAQVLHAGQGLQTDGETRWI